jgi:hypothetical protein
VANFCFRECTWPKAVEYYSNNLEATGKNFQAFPDTDNAACVALVREFVKDVNVKEDNAHIRSNFAFFKLKASRIPLPNSVAIVENVQEQMRTTSEESEKVKRKWDAVLWWNPRYFSMKALSKILDGEEAEIPAAVKCWNILKFKYAPITCVDTEQFSQLTNLFWERKGTSLNQKILVIYCAANYGCNFQSPLFAFHTNSLAINIISDYSSCRLIACFKATVVKLYRLFSSAAPTGC